jgi:hypothetical protein
MPDISMCSGGFCPLKLNCHRYTAEAEPLGQSYFGEPPYKMNMMLDDTFHSLGVVTTTCPFFWNNVDKKKNEKPTN